MKRFLLTIAIVLGLASNAWAPPPGAMIVREGENVGPTNVNYGLIIGAITAADAPFRIDTQGIIHMESGASMYASGGDAGYADSGGSWVAFSTFGTPRLDEVLNPNTDKTFTMGNSQLKFTYTAPNPSDGAFEIEGIGGFQGDLVHIHQHTGNPTAAVDLLHIEAVDNEVLPLRIIAPSSVHTAISISGNIKINGTVDGVDVSDLFEVIPGSNLGRTGDTIFLDNIIGGGVGSPDVILGAQFTQSNPYIVFTSTTNNDHIIQTTGNSLKVSNMSPGGDTLLRSWEFDVNGAFISHYGHIKLDTSINPGGVAKLEFDHQDAGADNYEILLSGTDILYVRNKSVGGITTKVSWQFQPDGDFYLANGNVELGASATVDGEDVSAVAVSSRAHWADTGNPHQTAGGGGAYFAGTAMALVGSTFNWVADTTIAMASGEAFILSFPNITITMDSNGVAVSGTGPTDIVGALTMSGEAGTDGWYVRLTSAGAVYLGDPSGGTVNSFATWDVENGTDPVADSSTDTILIYDTSTIQATGNATADSISFAVIESGLDLDNIGGTLGSDQAVAAFMLISEMSAYSATGLAAHSGSDIIHQTPTELEAVLDLDNLQGTLGSDQATAAFVLESEMTTHEADTNAHHSPGGGGTTYWSRSNNAVWPTNAGDSLGTASTNVGVAYLGTTNITGQTIMTGPVSVVGDLTMSDAAPVFRITDLSGSEDDWRIGLNNSNFSLEQYVNDTLWRQRLFISDSAGFTFDNSAGTDIFVVDVNGNIDTGTWTSTAVDEAYLDTNWSSGSIGSIAVTTITASGTAALDSTVTMSAVCGTNSWAIIQGASGLGCVELTGGAETNTLETTITGIESGEVFYGTGSNAGVFTAHNFALIADSIADAQLPDTNAMDSELHTESHDNTYHSTNYEVEDAFLTFIAGLTDPAGDRGLGWDDTNNDIRFFTWGTNIAYDQATDTVNVTGGSGDMTAAVWAEGVVPNSAIDQDAGGTNLDTSGVTNGQMLIGNTTSNVWALGTITGSTNELDVATGAGTLEIGLVASPTTDATNITGPSGITALGAQGEDLDMNTSWTVASLAAPATAGEAIRATTNITEAALENITDGSETTEHTHAGGGTPALEDVTALTQDNTIVNGTFTWTLDMTAASDVAISTDGTLAAKIFKSNVADGEFFIQAVNSNNTFATEGYAAYGQDSDHWEGYDSDSIETFAWLSDIISSNLTIDADVDMLDTYQLINLAAPVGADEAVRTTSDITEAALIDVTDGGETTEHSHAVGTVTRNARVQWWDVVDADDDIIIFDATGAGTITEIRCFATGGDVQYIVYNNTADVSNGAHTCTAGTTQVDSTLTNTTLADGYEVQVDISVADSATKFFVQVIYTE